MRPSLKATLATVFAIIALISVGQAVLSIRDLATIRGNIEDLAWNRLPSVDAINRINTAARDNRVKLYRLVVASGTPESLSENRKAAAEAREALMGLGKAYEALISSSEERTIYARYSALSSRYVGEQDNIMSSMDAGRQSDALALLIRPALAALAKDLAGVLQEGIELNKREAEASARDGLESAATATRNAYAAMALAVAASLAAALFSLFGISRPVAAMTAAMRALAGGDAGVAVPSIGRGDEIGAMASAVQVFKDNLIHTRQLEEETVLARAGAEAQRKAAMREVADRFEQAVGSIVGGVTAAATQLQSTAQGMAGTAKATADMSGAVACAAEEAASNVGTVAAAAEELGASVHEIGRQVSDSEALALAAVSEAARTADLVHELSTAVAKVGEVVTLISAIAGQTNLLALNATIEAARAGEAGRGFAVVAAEVKELANQTARATEEIGGHIGRIQGSTSQAVSAIDAITVRIREISSVATTIAASVEEQGAATQEIVRNVAEAATGTGEVTGNIAGVAAAAGETGAAASQVLASAAELSQKSEQLGVEVSRFLATVRAA